MKIVSFVLLIFYVYRLDAIPPLFDASVWDLELLTRSLTMAKFEGEFRSWWGRM